MDDGSGTGGGENDEEEGKLEVRLIFWRCCSNGEEGKVVYIYVLWLVQAAQFRRLYIEIDASDDGFYVASEMERHGETHRRENKRGVDLVRESSLGSSDSSCEHQSQVYTLHCWRSHVFTLHCWRSHVFTLHCWRSQVYTLHCWRSHVFTLHSWRSQVFRLHC